ncbi:uncharacterized protein LOC117901101 [Drosophila subobscura]|uniref:uncharacterized protein LOC117901101 n=1 Tax=Drosophila subobscura TaxID=7241 RepID=UPI00155A94E7|nr:uncharacterized protein LOC117901101 [Drosophila subobscura]
MEYLMGRLWGLVFAASSGLVYNSDDALLIGGNLSIQKLIDQNIEDAVEKFDVNMENCKMPQLRVLSVRQRPRAPEICIAKHPRLIVSKWNPQRQQYQLKIQQEVAAQLSGEEKPIVECSYRVIDHGRLRQPAMFRDQHLVPKHVQGMRLQCALRANRSYAMHSRHVSEDLSFVQLKEELPRLSNRQPSVLLLGIDSMSRGNLRLVLPNVSHFLAGRQWHEMRGFNAVGDNKLMDCPDRLSFVLQDFKLAGYVTAMSEDRPEKGMCQRHTVDHYLRPMPMPKLRRCLRKRRGMEHTLDYCTQLIERYVRGSQPFFGFFWIHAEASHHDELLFDYLKRFEVLGLYEEAIVVLFSDHGMRFGNLVKLRDDQLEERQPMLFVTLPKWFRKCHPGFSRALQLNRHRLSSPYDLKMMLKHVASLQVYHESPRSYSRCQSLFYALPKNRSCYDAGIRPHWCTCEAYRTLPLSDNIQTMSHFVIQRINQFLSDLSLLNRCSKLRLSGIRGAQRKERSPQDEPNMILYRLQLEALPNKLVFEATVSYNELTQLMDTDIWEISRKSCIDLAASCIGHQKASVFCVCHNRITYN